MPAWTFDTVLALGLVIAAWRSVGARDLFTAVVMFIAFGLLMAIAWTRLDAPDIALAEAAIGAGLTGALLLDALGHIAGQRREPPPPAAVREDDLPQGGPATRLGMVVLAAAGAAVLGAAAWTLPLPRDTAGEAALAALASHPLANAATAVLLDFRAYDTFLEMVVLALAGFGVVVLKARQLTAEQAEPPVRTSSLLPALAGALVPLMIVAAVYLYWAGSALSGGAFPAGAMLAAAGVLLVLAGADTSPVRDRALVRATLVLGTVAFLAAGAMCLLAGGAFLEWPPGTAYAGILAVEGVLTLAIGGTLALLYAVSAREPRDADEARETP